MATTNSRRRPVTYGKTTRKPSTSINPSAANVFSRVAFADEIRSLDEEDFPTISKTHSLGVTKSPVKLNGRNTIIRPASSPSKVFKRHGANSTSTDWKTLHGIPSSDEEIRQTSIVREAAGRKRRRITPNSQARSETMLPNSRTQGSYNFIGIDKIQVADSCSSQGPSVPVLDQEVAKAFNVKGYSRHTSQPAIPRIHSQKPHFAPWTGAFVGSENLNAIADLESRELISTPKEGFDKASAGDEEHVFATSKVSESSIRATIDSGKSHNVSELTANVAAPDLNLSGSLDQASDTDCKLPQTPPKPLRPSSAVTTPHQRGLWDMLLPQVNHTDSPSSLDITGLSLAKQKTHNISTVSGQEMEKSPRSMAKVKRQSQKTRLVDSLQCQDDLLDDEELVLNDEETIDGGDSEDGSALDNPQKPNEGFSGEGQTSSIAEHQCSKSIDPVQKSYYSGQPAQVPPNIGTKATYARQRSYLTDDDIVESSAFDLPALQESAADRRSKKRAADSNVEETAEPQAPVLRSIHELRRAGGNSRLLSEIEAMMEDISNQGLVSLSVRRSRLLELVRKLQEPLFKATFADQGFGSRLIANVEHNHDSIESLLVCCVIMQLLRGTSSPRVVLEMRSPPFIRFLARLLNMEEDIIEVSRIRGTNMSRFAQNELVDFCGWLLNSEIWSTGKPRVITAQLASLQCLELLVRQSREAGNSDDLLPSDILRKITRLLEVPPQDVTFQSVGVPNIALQLAVSILESCTVIDNDKTKQHIWSGRPLESILGLLPALESSGADDSESLRSLILRLYLNLTNNDPVLCQSFSRPDVLQPIFDIVILNFGRLSRDDAASKLLLDSLILALGSLINLAEWCESVRLTAMELQHQGQSYLDLFLQLFLVNSEKSAEVRA